MLAVKKNKGETFCTQQRMHIFQNSESGQEIIGILMNSLHGEMHGMMIKSELQLQEPSRNLNMGTSQHKDNHLHRIQMKQLLTNADFVSNTHTKR